MDHWYEERMDVGRFTESESDKWELVQTSKEMNECSRWTIKEYLWDYKGVLMCEKLCYD